MYRKVFIFFLACALLAVMLGGCSGSAHLDRPNAGRTTSYVAGLPDFDMEALVTWEEGRAGVDLYLGIPRASLVYVQRDSIYEASYQAVIRVYEPEGEVLLRERTLEDTLRVQSYEQTQRYAPAVDTVRLVLAPGRYTIEVAMEDGESGQDALRRVRVEVPGPRETLHLSDLHFLRQEGRAPLRPALALHVQSGFDTLRAVTELRQPTDRRVDVQMRLLRFRSDTSVAEPPFMFTPLPGSIIYRGVDFRAADTLQTTRRTIQAQGKVALEFVIPALDPGVYRIEVHARTIEGGQTWSRGRTFAVKSADFPRVRQLDEMVQALSYIAREEELAHILAAETPREMRRRFDAFWGQLVPQRQKAANILETYYERVQEANLRFSAHKAGWKTDRGMVYILLGPPISTQRHPSAITWHYSYDMGDALNTFVFRRVTGPRDYFDHAVLQRQPYYEQSWGRVVERWREGDVF